MYTLTILAKCSNPYLYSYSMHAEAQLLQALNTVYGLKISGIFVGLEKLTLKNFDPSKMPLKTYFQLLILSLRMQSLLKRALFVT